MTLDELKHDCIQCKKCPLYESRTNLVFGTGCENADILFIGEAPGKDEDLQGVPFVGRSGKLLDKYFEAVGINRESIYIANILKCRPPNNRDPKPEEEECCIDWLREQTRLINPKMIVCLGRIAAMKIISPTFRITAQHGQFTERKGVVLCAVYHPSLLLRDPRKKDDMMEDMLNIVAKAKELGLRYD